MPLPNSVGDDYRPIRLECMTYFGTFLERCGGSVIPNGLEAIAWREVVVPRGCT